MRPVVLVHGFGYDPAANGRDNPEISSFPEWDRVLFRDTIGHPWYSAPPGVRHVLRAWRNGYWNRYRYAWDLALDEAKLLRTRLRRLDEYDIFCHSLGSRVVMNALRDECAGRGLRRVLILNGAEYATTGHAVAKTHPRSRFFNVVVRDDDILSKFGRFAPGFGGRFLGNHGLPGHSLSNWTDVVLDCEEVQAWGVKRGWSLRGDNPYSWGDHWYSFRWAGNWPLYRSILDGELAVKEVPECL